MKARRSFLKANVRNVLQVWLFCQLVSGMGSNSGLTQLAKLQSAINAARCRMYCMAVNAVESMMACFVQPIVFLRWWRLGRSGRFSVHWLSPSWELPLNGREMAPRKATTSLPITAPTWVRHGSSLISPSFFPN